MKTKRRYLLPPVTVSSSMVFWAFRYCLGRRTYAVSDCVGEIFAVWKKLDPNTQRKIKQEIGEAIKGCFAGMELDVNEWRTILKLPIKGDK